MAECVVPIADKHYLTVDEMSAYTNIGVKKLYYIIDKYKDEGFLLRIGNKTLFKKKAFTDFVDTLDCL